MALLPLKSMSSNFGICYYGIRKKAFFPKNSQYPKKQSRVSTSAHLKIEDVVHFDFDDHI